MPKYSLTKTDEKYLTIEINGKSYNIPLASSLRLKDLRKIMKAPKLEEAEQLDFLVDFFGKYIGEEVADELTLSQIWELFGFWKEANKEAGGLPLGE